MRRRYLVPMGATSVLYTLNRFFLAPLTGSHLLAWYGADFLAGALMLCLLNGMLERLGQKPVRGIGAVSAFALGFGLFWKVATPLYLPRSVVDPRDILAVWLGAMAMLAVWRLTER